ncbi:phosphoglycerate dehydrogenase [Candidatus Liberibacter sp.]|uniref:phosphoglycerate dehydrogenase n=1 Tax=Candidatus Liberibacter sp. TaxID=34022 RepID=UPI0015F4147D|nr:phosphoglycerate dehydrogenase [Candidatus Liberibacter sp.]MBA5724511.1 phosphoglycerate dehydrogenase [Candidatus Liberibacter sp.]
MKPRVLVSDRLSLTAIQVFRDYGIDVDFCPEAGKNKEELARIIGDYDGLAVRSTTKVTQKLLLLAKKLKVVGRAGIGIDNVDISAASQGGVIVMNTPFGNSITAAEHAITLMLAVARQIPAANASTHAGFWEKSKFMGVEITGKILGVIGVGNIGSQVCTRAIGLKMQVIAYDPFLSQECAQELGISKVNMEELLSKSDFISLHVPLTDKTKNILNSNNLSKTKPGVRIINCARGGLVDEEALACLIKSGHVAGVGFDVFEVEPALNSPLFGLQNVVCTPHLGASTIEAQEKVAFQLAHQMSAYLTKGTVSNALNMPSISLEEGPLVRPFIKLADYLGHFMGQLIEEPIKEIEIIYDGSTAAMNTKALSSIVLSGMVRVWMPEANMVSAPIVIKDRSIVLSEVRRDKSGVWDGYIELIVKTGSALHSIAGTVFSDEKPRFIKIQGVNFDADIGRHMIYMVNQDTPGMVGFVGSILGEARVNIANFQLGRGKSRGGDAVSLLYVDGSISNDILSKLSVNPAIRSVKRFEFNVD